MKYLQEIDSFAISKGAKEKPTSRSRGGIYKESAESLNSEALLSQYYNGVVRYLGVFGINRAYLEDAVQDTMVEAIECIKSVRDITKIKYRILKIAKRIGLKYVKISKDNEITTCSYDEIIDNGREDIDFISDRMLYAQVNQISDEYLIEILEKALSTKERSVIILYYVYGHKLKEIAEIMGEPESTVRSLSARAKKKLKVKLEKGGYHHER